MKREFLIFVAIIAVILAAAVSLKTIMLNIATNHLKGAFPGYKVSVGNAEIKSADLISLTDIKLKKGVTNLYRIKRLDIRLSPLSFFNRVIPKAYIRNAQLSIDSPTRKLKDLIEYPAPKPGAVFLVDSLEIENLSVEFHTSDCDISAILWADVSVKKQITYDVNLKLNRVDLGLLVKGLGASDKLDLKGSMNGTLRLNGRDLKITAIKGEFATDEPGGSILIKDDEFIKMLAERSKQPVELIRDSFKSYDFTKGTLGVSRDNESILLHVMLDGLKGKRDLTVALHGF